MFALVCVAWLNYMGHIFGDILGFYWGYIGIMENKMEATVMDIAWACFQ